MLNFPSLVRGAHHGRLSLQASAPGKQHSLRDGLPLKESLGECACSSPAPGVKEFNGQPSLHALVLERRRLPHSLCVLGNPYTNGKGVASYKL